MLSLAEIWGPTNQSLIYKYILKFTISLHLKLYLHYQLYKVLFIFYTMYSTYNTEQFFNLLFVHPSRATGKYSLIDWSLLEIQSYRII